VSGLPESGIPSIDTYGSTGAVSLGSVLAGRASGETTTSTGSTTASLTERSCPDPSSENSNPKPTKTPAATTASKTGRRRPGEGPFADSESATTLFTYVRCGGSKSDGWRPGAGNTLSLPVQYLGGAGVRKPVHHRLGSGHGSRTTTAVLADRSAA
jgi:hypothetical protein